MGSQCRPLHYSASRGNKTKQINVSECRVSEFRLKVQTVADDWSYTERLLRRCSGHYLQNEEISWRLTNDLILEDGTSC